MVETLSYRGKWNELGKELETIIRFNESLPKEEKKTLTKIFEDFAEKYDTTLNSASRYYYNEIKPRLEEEPIKPLNIDESINTFANSDLKDIRTFYKIGDTLEVEITSIQDFGVFARTKEGFEGLIHISEITGKHYVDMPQDFFYIGEKVKVKLKRIDYEGKIAFSTRMIGGKEKINPAFRDIAKATIGDIAKVTVKSKDDRIDIPLKVAESKPVVEEVKTITNSKDRDKIIDFIKKYSDNNVSNRALTDIDEMFGEYGIFETTIALMEAVRDLDISAFITNMTKEKLAGEYLRRS